MIGNIGVCGPTWAVIAISCYLVDSEPTVRFSLKLEAWQLVDAVAVCSDNCNTKCLYTRLAVCTAGTPVGYTANPTRLT